MAVPTVDRARLSNRQCKIQYRYQRAQYLLPCCLQSSHRRRMEAFLESVEELSTSVLCECDIIVLAIHTLLSTSNFLCCQKREEIIQKTSSGNYAEMKFLRYEVPFFIRLVQNYENITIMASYNDIFSTLTLDPSSFVLKERNKSNDFVVAVKEWNFKFNSFSSRFRNVIVKRLLGENPEDTHFSSLTPSMKLHILSFLKVCDVFLPCFSIKLYVFCIIRLMNWQECPSTMISWSFPRLTYYGLDC